MNSCKNYYSNVEFPEIQRLVTEIHQLTNAHLYIDLRDMPEEERLKKLEYAKKLMEEWLS